MDTVGLIVDSHMHVGDFGAFKVSMDRDGLMATLRDHHISAGLIFHPDNLMVREIVRDTPGAYGLVWANPHEPGAAEKVASLLDEQGSRFRGVKLHPLIDSYLPDDPAVHPIIETLIERGLPVLIHCGHPIFSLPWSIEDLVRRYPEARIILGHMGMGNVVYNDACIAIAERNPNVYLETSHSPMHAKIKEAVDRLGAEKVLYGSDAPFGHPTVELARVRVSGLSEHALARVLGENARDLFFSGLLAEANM